MWLGTWLVVVGGVLWKCKERRVEEINENEMMDWVEVEDSLLGNGINWWWTPKTKHVEWLDLLVMPLNLRLFVSLFVCDVGMSVIPLMICGNYEGNENKIIVLFCWRLRHLLGPTPTYCTQQGSDDPFYFCFIRPTHNISVHPMSLHKHF